MSRGRGRAPRLVTLAEIQQRFQLAPLTLDGTTSAIGRARRKTGGWWIRVAVQVERRDGATDWRTDQFDVAGDGTILGAPWGFAKDYRPGRMDPAELEAAAGSKPTEATEPAR
jgi:hypothetical protein